MSPVIEAENLSCWYGQVVGVNDVTASVEPGITGLLGPNAAGKSTFLKLVTGQIRPGRGRLRVLGEVPFGNARLYRRIGFAPEHDGLYPDMSPLSFVTYLQRLHGFRREEAGRRAEAALRRTGLHDARSRRLGTLSKGTRQKVRLAQAIAHDPALLILDEPLSGLDPAARADFIAILRDLAAAGTSILVSSHILREVESLTDSVLLLHRGRILAAGPVPAIRNMLDRHPRKIRFRLRDPRPLAREILSVPGVVGILIGEGTLTVDTTDIAVLESRLPGIVSDVRPGVAAMERIDSGLEAVFDYLVSAP